MLNDKEQKNEELRRRKRTAGCRKKGKMEIEVKINQAVFGSQKSEAISKILIQIFLYCPYAS
jgi:hypothetical protein